MTAVRAGVIPGLIMSLKSDSLEFTSDAMNVAESFSSFSQLRMYISVFVNNCDVCAIRLQTTTIIDLKNITILKT